MFDQPKPRIIVTAGAPVTDTGTEIMEAIARAAQATMKAQAERIDQLLLEGSDEVRVKGVGVQEYVYCVPPWREHPVNRLRIEWRRWCWRRSQR